MSVWENYSNEQRQEYIKFLQVYGALTNLFRQKKGDLIPYLDSKFQETIFAKIFNGQNVDIGNTPHDIVSIFGNERIGIGLKTWMNSKPSYQKVMQLKKYQNEINVYKNDLLSLAYKISEIKNERMISDHVRLGLDENKNIYHYVTRDEGKFTINECSYPLIELHKIKNLKKTDSALIWSDNKKDYKFTFADSQIWQKFDSNKYNSIILKEFDVDIIKDPFKFLLNAYSSLILNPKETEKEFVEVYLPLYSFKKKDVGNKSGLNAWNGASKNKGSEILRPLNEVYIPIPIEFHKNNPNFFAKDIFKTIYERKIYKKDKNRRPEIRFHLELPNGKRIPALITGDNLKNFQSGSKTERDKNGVLFGQSALGQWLLIDVLGLKERKLVTREWLYKKGTDSIKLWRRKNDYSTIYVDFAPFGSFESFMNNEPIISDED